MARISSEDNSMRQSGYHCSSSSYLLTLNTVIVAVALLTNVLFDPETIYTSDSTTVIIFPGFKT
jgi:hypothetical protein